MYWATNRPNKINDLFNLSDTLRPPISFSTRKFSNHLNDPNAVQLSIFINLNNLINIAEIAPSDPISDKYIFNACFGQ